MQTSFVHARGDAVAALGENFEIGSFVFRLCRSSEKVLGHAFFLDWN